MYFKTAVNYLCKNNAMVVVKDIVEACILFTISAAVCMHEWNMNAALEHVHVE